MGHLHLAMGVKRQKPTLKNHPLFVVSWLVPDGASFFIHAG